MSRSDVQYQKEAWDMAVTSQARLDAHFQVHDAPSNEEIQLVERLWAEVVKQGRIRKAVAPFERTVSCFAGGIVGELRRIRIQRGAEENEDD